MFLTSRVFWARTADRVVGSFAAALAAVLGAGAVGVMAVAWPAALSVAGGAALVTLLKCVIAATSDTGGKDNPGFVE